MPDDPFPLSPRSRREFLGTTALAAGALGLSLPKPATAAARWRRVNVTDPAAKPHLESYKKAIRAMLALPATDPRNWYRYALIHTLDCPHGNWWFLPWHRAYLLDFERELQRIDPEVSLPYWRFDRAAPKVFARGFMGVVVGGQTQFSAANPLKAWAPVAGPASTGRAAFGTN